MLGSTSSRPARSSVKQPTQLDGTDKKILSLLLANARESVTDMAKKLGLGRTTVHERLAKLERSGVIVGYSTILASDASETMNRAFVMLSIVQRMQGQLIERLRALPEVLECNTVSGDFDVMLTVETPQLDDLDAVLDEILRLPGVERCRSSIVMTKHFQRSRSGAAIQTA